MKTLCLALGRPFSPHALAFARQVAGRTQSGVDLLYVAAKEAGRPAGESAIKEAGELLGEVKANEELRIGKALDQLKAHLAEHPLDLLVLRSPVTGGVLAGAANIALRRVIARPPLNAVVVRQEPTEVQRVLICTGGMEGGLKVIEEGARIAAALGASVTLLYVAATVPTMYTGLAEVEEELHELLETDTPIARCLRRGAEIIDSHGVPGELELRHGVVAEQILRESLRGGFDLLVLGASRVRADLRGMLLGDVTQEVISGASIPVLIVK